jgi:hypothetical protein
MGATCHLPFPVADLLGLGKEVRQLAGVEALLAFGAHSQQRLALPVELAVQLGKEGERRRGEDFLRP